MSTTSARPVVERAYRKWKQSVYYERNDLFQRQALAAFETAGNIAECFDEIVEILEGVAPDEDKRFLKWLKGIKTRLLPKKICRPDNNDESNEGVFLSNITSDEEYTATKVNYVFDGPVQLHILAALWLMVEGYALDQSLSDDAYGSRLDESLYEEDDPCSFLFRHYPTQYARWRDTAIKHAERLLKDEKQGVCLLALDIQQFYYRVRVDFDRLATELDELKPNSRFQLLEFETTVDLRHSLRAMVRKTIERYREVIRPTLKFTHDIEGENIGIPLSFCVSPVLANWTLREFDESIRREINPAYYGRYVDDMLLVVPDHLLRGGKQLPRSSDKERRNPIQRFLNHVFVRRGLLAPAEGHSYTIVGRPELVLQQEKCMLQHFDAEHSSAGLEKFKHNLQQASSEFRLLPDDDIERPLKDVAWQLIYEGSANKLRSVKGFREDRNELAKYLSKRLALHLHTDTEMEESIVEELFHFFKGVNALEFPDMWERVLTLLLVAGKDQRIRKLSAQIAGSIEKLNFVPEHSAVSDENRMSIRTTQSLRDDMMEHLELCLAMARGLSGDWESSRGSRSQRIHDNALLFRESNMIRHHLVRYPLANYTLWQGSLVTDAPPQKYGLDERRIQLSPRFVYLNELMNFHLGRNIAKDPAEHWERIKKDYVRLNGTEVQGAETTSPKE